MNFGGRSLSTIEDVVALNFDLKELNKAILQVASLIARQLLGLLRWRPMYIIYGCLRYEDWKYSDGRLSKWPVLFS